MPQDKDVNLLPANLRSREESERQKPVSSVPTKYSQPSVLAKRLQEAEAEEASSWWNKIKSWFNRVPDITKVVPAKEEIEFKKKIGTESIKETKASKTNWFRKFFSAQSFVPPPSATKNKDKDKVIPSKAVPLPPAKTADQPVTAPPLPKVPLGVVLDVNLLPLTARASKIPFYLKKLGLVVLATAAVVGLLYGIVFTLITLEQVEIKKIQEDAHTLVQQIESAKNDLAELERISQRMILIKDLVKQRPDWLKFFSTLEDLTLSNVKYSSLSVTREGVAVLPVQAYSVSDIAQQLVIFQQAKNVIAEVALGSISVGESTETKKTTVTSSFQLKLVPGWISAK